MAGRLTTTSSTIMEDREALKREAARERQKRGAMSAGLPGNGTQNRPNRSSVLEPHATLNATLFAAPVKVEQEDATSLMIKTVLGSFQNIPNVYQGSAAPHTHGPSPHFGSAQPAQHQPQNPQQNRRPLPAGAPPVDSRSAQRQPNGVSSPLRGLHPQPNPKQAAISQAPNYSKPPLMTAAARKEPVASAKPVGQDLQKKGTAPPFNNAASKSASNNNSSSNNNNNNNNVGSNRLSLPTDLSRIEEVLKEMKVPPLLPDIDEVDRRESRRREEREERQRNPPSVTVNDVPTFPSSLGIGGLPLLPIEPPPVALSPMSSPQGDTVATTASVPLASTASVVTNQNQRLHSQAPAAAPQPVAPMSAPGVSSGSASLAKKPFDVSLPHSVPMTTLSSDSSESEDEDDHESASQEDSQDSDVEQKPVRMNQAFDKSFASTEKFPDKSNQFGDGGVPSLFPQQRVPQLQVQPPNSTEGQSIESPLSASDDTNAEESKASWSLAAFMQGATPNSVTSSVKSPIKSSPRRSPTPSCDATPSKTTRETRNEYGGRKRGLSGSDHSKESSIEPTSSVEKRRPAPVGRRTRNSTPDSEGTSVPKNAAVRKLNTSRVSPLAQNHHEGSNGVAPDEPSTGASKKRKAVAEDDSSLLVRIPLSMLKRKPPQGSKCDNSSNQVGGNNLASHGDLKSKPERFESSAPTKLNVDESRDSRDVQPSKTNNGEDRRADSPMSIESISSSSSSRKRHHSPEEKNKKFREDAQFSRKKPTEKRDRSKAEADANLRRDRESSTSRKDDKRKTMPEDKRARDDRRAIAGPSSSSSSGSAQPSNRPKDDRREPKQDNKNDTQEQAPEPYPLYRDHLTKNRFEWGFTLSDAAVRAAEERKRTKYDTFIEEAKALKHSGDSESTNVMKAKKYLQSAACFLSAGNLMELTRLEMHTAVKMFQDTLLLVKHTSGQVLSKASVGGTQECRLGILCLKVQAFLYDRIYTNFNRDKDTKERLMNSYQEFLRLPGNSKHFSNEQQIPNGAIVSPANSIGSASSGVQNSRDNGVRQDIAVISQAKQVTLSLEQVSNVQKYLYRLSFAARAVDLWAQAENMTVESNNLEFFQAVESASASVSLASPTTTFVLYIREAIYRIDKFNGIV